MPETAKPLAIVTGASSGIGYELAKLCAQNGYDLLIAADRAAIHDAAKEFQALGAEVEAVEADLATLEGVDKLYAAAKGRPVDALLANAGHGLGHAFLDQDFAEVRHVIDTNITGTIYLIQKVGRDMRASGEGRILITGSIAGFMPGTFQAVYNGTKAFIDSFSFALRNELKDTGVTVTCLMPGATETEFFERADMVDTQGRPGQEGRSRRCGEGRLRRDDERRRRRGERLEEQVHDRPRQRHAGRHAGRAAPQDGRAGIRKALSATLLRRACRRMHPRGCHVDDCSPDPSGAIAAIGTTRRPRGIFR